MVRQAHTLAPRRNRHDPPQGRRERGDSRMFSREKDLRRMQRQAPGGTLCVVENSRARRARGQVGRAPVPQLCQTNPISRVFCLKMRVGMKNKPNFTVPAVSPTRPNSRACPAQSTACPRHGQRASGVPDRRQDDRFFGYLFAEPPGAAKKYLATRGGAGSALGIAPAAGILTVEGVG